MMRSFPDSQRFGASDLMHQLDRGTGIFQAKTASGEYIPVHGRMQVREAAGKLDFFFVDSDRTKRRFAFAGSRPGKIITVNRQEPGHARPFQFEIPADPGRVGDVQFAVFDPPNSQISKSKK